MPFELDSLLKLLAERQDLINLLTRARIFKEIHFPSEEAMQLLARDLLNHEKDVTQFIEILKPFVEDLQQLPEIANNILFNNKLAVLIEMAEKNQSHALKTYFILLQREIEWNGDQWVFNKHLVYDITGRFSNPNANTFLSCQNLINGENLNFELLDFLARVTEGEIERDYNVNLWRGILGDVRRKYIVEQLIKGKLKEKSAYHHQFADIINSNREIMEINLANLSLEEYNKTINFLSRQNDIHENHARKLFEICGIEAEPQRIDINGLFNELRQENAGEDLVNILKNTTLADHEVIVLPTSDELKKFAQRLAYVNTEDLADVGYYKADQVVPLLIRLGFDAEGQSNKTSSQLADKILETNILHHLINLAASKDVKQTQQFLAQLQQAGKTLDPVAAEIIRKCLLGDMENFRYANVWRAMLNLNIQMTEMKFDQLVSEWYRLHLHKQLIDKEEYSEAAQLLSDLSYTKIIDQSIRKELKEIRKREGKEFHEENFLGTLKKHIQKRSRSVTRAIVAWSKPFQSIEEPVKSINSKLIALATLVLEGKKFELSGFINFFKQSLEGKITSKMLDEFYEKLTDNSEKQVFFDCRENLLLISDYCEKHKNAIEVFLVHKKILLDIIAKIKNPLAQAILLKENLDIQKESLNKKNVTALEKINQLAFKTEAELAFLFREVGLGSLEKKTIQNLFTTLIKPNLDNVESLVLQGLIKANPKIKLSAGASAEINEKLRDTQLNMQKFNDFLQVSDIPLFLSRENFYQIKLEVFLQHHQLDAPLYKKQESMLKEGITKFSKLRKKGKSPKQDLMEEIRRDLPDYTKTLGEFKEKIVFVSELKKMERVLNEKEFKHLLHSDELLKLVKDLDKHKKLVMQMEREIARYTTTQEKAVKQLMKKEEKIKAPCPKIPLMQRFKFTKEQPQMHDKNNDIELHADREQARDFFERIQNQKYAVKEINENRLAKPQTVSGSPNLIKFKPDNAHGLEYMAKGNMLYYQENTGDGYIDQKRICEDMAARFIAAQKDKTIEVPLFGEKKLQHKMAICLTALGELFEMKVKIVLNEGNISKPFKPSLVQRHQIADKKKFFLKHDYIKGSQLLMIGNILRPST